MFISKFKKEVLSIYFIFMLIIAGFIGLFIFNGIINNNLSAKAATIYVDSIGSGDYTSIQTAVDNANPGDTIIVANGTYNESITINKANITLIGNSTSHCNIKHYYVGSDYINDFAAGINITANGVKISGFNITVSGRYIYGIHLNSFSSHSNITKNNISTSGKYSYGIFLYHSSNNTLVNNIIITHHTNSHGIYLQQSSNDNVLIGNTITLSGGYPRNGIYVISSSNIEIIQNQINGYRYTLEYGVYLFDTTNTILNKNKMNNCSLKLSGNSLKHWNTHNIDNSNTINDKPIYYYKDTSNVIIPLNPAQVIIVNCSNMKISNINFDTCGIIIAFSENSIIKNSQFNNCTVYLYSSNNNTINENIISMSSFVYDYCIHLEKSNYNNLSVNSITGYMPLSNSIILSFSSNNNLIENNITTGGISASGIYLSHSFNNNIKYNLIKLIGKSVTGIYLTTSSKNNIEGNTINANSWWTYGISLSYSSNNNLKINNITMGECCISLSHSSKNQLKSNIITGDGDGIRLLDTSNNNFLSDNIINLAGMENRWGIWLAESDNNFIIDTKIVTKDKKGHGIYLDGMFVTIVNPIITTNKFVGSYDLVAINGGEITVIGNYSFETVQVTEDGGGVLKLKNYLGIEIYDDDISPISGADVEVMINGTQFYASAGYGGIDSTTDANGKIETLLVTYRAYIYNNTPIENIIGVKVKKAMGTDWEVIRPDINMSASHTEFFYYDLTPPSIPTGLKVNRIPGTNTLNISWDHNLDTVNYAIYSNSSGQWELIYNITHPQNWSLDRDLQDCKWYYYKIQAWDKAGHFSGLSETVSYYLFDITPPVIPTGLTVNPVIGGDELNISWNLNPDTTILYDIVWKDPLTGEWTWLDNVTHPKNWYILSNENLINGNTYYFKIRACYQDIMVSQYSTLASVIHRDYLAPEEPSNLWAEASSQTEIELEWTGSNSLDVEGYQIHINISGSSSNVTYQLLNKVSAMENNYIVTDLVENTQYYFVVTAFDEANNTSPYSEEAKCTTIGIPTVKATIPEQNSTNVEVDKPMTIIFSISMNTNTVEKVLEIVPDVDYHLNWTKNNTVLRIDFTENLSYNMSYVFTIGRAKSATGGSLKDWPFILNFRTEKETIFQFPTIIITSPTANTIVKPGESITLFGISTGLDVGIQIVVILNGYNTTGIIESNGTWSITFKAPNIEGNYTIEVIAGNASDSIDIIVIDNEFEEDDDDITDNDTDKSFLEMTGIIIFGSILVIIIIVIFIFLIIIKRKRTLKDIEIWERMLDEEHDKEFGQKEPFKDELKEELKDQELDNKK